MFLEYVMYAQRNHSFFDLLITINIYDLIVITLSTRIQKNRNYKNNVYIHDLQYI